MVRKPYIPDQGDVVWVELDPSLGHEQKGRRPAIILSNKSYNQLVGLAIVCPITSQVKGYAFEVSVQMDQIQGAILVDQVRSVDWKHRKVTFIARGTSVIGEVKAKLAALIR